MGRESIAMHRSMHAAAEQAAPDQPVRRQAMSSLASVVLSKLVPLPSSYVCLV